MIALEDKPAAWLVKKLVDFTHAKKVHFTRTGECTLSDIELMDSITGTVINTAQVVYLKDSAGYVVDRHGVKHYDEPLYRAKSKLTTNSESPIWAPGVEYRNENIESQ